jgi:RNA polymerase sigma-70 factor (ECF subfamily)
LTEQEKDSVYRNYNKKILCYIIGKGISEADAEDLCANIFVKFYNSLDKYDSSKSSPSTWLYRITQNTIIDFFRVRKQSAELKEEMAYMDKGFDEVLNNETLTELGQALMKLDLRSRSLVVFVYYDGKTLKEAAAQLNMSYSNSKIIMKKALSELKAFLE